MSEIIVLVVHFIPVKNNFVHIHSKLLPKFQNTTNSLGCIAIKQDDNVHYGSCYATPFNANGENALNISTAYATSLSLKEYEAVIVSSAEYLKPLKSIHVTPSSADDWEILENTADTIQSTLLNQIRVIFAHQTLSVWVSKSIVLKVHIDKLNDDNSCGKLEPYSEVIVLTEVKKCTVCSQSQKIEQETTNAWNFSFFKDIISLVKPKEKLPVEEPSPELKSEFLFLGIFRCSINEDVSSVITSYPYNILISEKYIERSITNGRGNPILCRLSHTQEIYAHLFILEDVSSLNLNTKFLIVDSYPTVYVSSLLTKIVEIPVNGKLKIDIVKNSQNVDVTEINLSFLNSNSSDNLDNYPKYLKELQDFLRSYTQIHDSIVINNNSYFQVLDQILYCSFNPANQNFLEMSFNNIENCNFKFIDRKIEDKFRRDEAPNRNNLLQFSFFESISRRLTFTILLELGLLRNYDNELFTANSNHIIIEGDNGTGKSSIVQLFSESIRSNYDVYVKIIECKSLKGKLVAKLKTVFESALTECVHFQPSVLIFDDLDVLFVSSKQNNQQHSERSISSYTNRLSALICDLIRSHSTHRITVLATATHLTSLEPNLFQARGASIFSIKLRVPDLDQDMRQDALIQLLIEKYNITSPESIINCENVEKINQRLEGYCIQDIADLADRIYFEIIKRQVKSKKCHVMICMDDIDQAISQTIPMSLKGVNFHKNFSIKWENIGGLETAKTQLTEILIWPSKYPKVFKQCPLKMQSGVLLYGAPGCGKTLLAGGVAGESSLNFISIKGPELLSKFVGESEEGVRNTFRRAQNAKPCLLFFDEFESLAPRRGNDITGVTDRVVNQLLTELDGVEAISGVWVLAATSRPDLIDPALLRPGRLGSMVYCPFPNQKERLSILKVISASSELSRNVDLDVVAQLTDGYTGADLQAVLYTAHQMRKDNGNEIDMESLLNAIAETKPSLKMAERTVYEKIYQRFSRSDEKILVEVDEQRLTYA